MKYWAVYQDEECKMRRSGCFLKWNRKDKTGTDVTQSYQLKKRTMKQSSNILDCHSDQK